MIEHASRFAERGTRFIFEPGQGLPVAAVANARQLLRAVETRPDLACHAPTMRSYLERYGER